MAPPGFNGELLLWEHHQWVPRLMPWRCPICGQENPDDIDVCVSCGAARPSDSTPTREASVETQAVGVEEGSSAAEGSSGGVSVLYLRIVECPARELVGRVVPVRLDLYGGKVTIGRSPENVVIIPDPTVSRRHAVIEAADGKIVLRDLGSTNGTYVYDASEGVFQRVEAVELKPGMLLRLGESTVLRVEGGEAVDSA